MSHKGAIRKIASSIDEEEKKIKSKPKSLSSNQASEKSEKMDIKLLRKTQTPEKTSKSDGHSKLTYSAQSSKSSTKLNTKLSKNIPVRESMSLTTKSSTNRSNARSALSSKTLTDSLRKPISSSPAKGSRSNGKVHSNYSEKRGLSTIFVPQSVSSKLNDKLVTKDTTTISKNEKESKLHSSASGTKSRQRKLSRTLSPSEIKMLHSAVDSQEIVQIGDQRKTKQAKFPQLDKEYDYEDDFEDYESDFQECTDSETSEIGEEADMNHSSPQLDPIELQTAKQPKVINSTEQKEEEQMHDSGHYELTEARKRAARIEAVIYDSKLSSLLEIKQPINKSYSEDKLENKSLPLSTDEGFEDSRSGDFTKSPPLSQTSFIEFHKAKEDKKTNVINISRKILNRGEELLEMIKLDVMEWSLLECSPIVYEDFIRSYGKLNTQQMSTQTGEDNMDTETQTEEIMSGEKWTQFPITCRTNLRTKRDLDLFRMDQIGVGNGTDTETTSPLPVPAFDVLRLNDFINRAGRVMLCLLEEQRSGGNVFKLKEKVQFSDGAVKLAVDSITFLAGRTVTIIHYSEMLNKILLTIHSPAEEEIETSSRQDYVTDCCIGCVWNIFEPSMPIKLFYSACPITACCFHLTNYSVVFAGLQDGSMSLWDLKEDEMWHHKVSDSANKLDWTIRMPTYTTMPCMHNMNDNSASPIVAIRVLSKIEETSLDRRNSKFISIQICSLSENGSLIIWTVLHNMGKNIEDLGLSFWGSVRLVKSQELLLQSHNRKIKSNADSFINMHVDCVDSNNLYIVSNSSNILRATCIGNKANPPMYTELDTCPCGNVTCMDICPYEESLFLVCCDDGTIRLHSMNIEKPILQIKNEDHMQMIKGVQWSRSKALTFFTLDNNSCIHIWDLSNSDIYPTYKVNMQRIGCITSMQLSTCKTERDLANQYLALGTESGNVEIHRLKENFYYSKKKDYLHELNTFKQYVAIL